MTYDTRVHTAGDNPGTSRRCCPQETFPKDTRQLGLEAGKRNA